VSRPPKIAVVDYGIGNLRSAEKALEHVGADAKLTAHNRDIEMADAVVLPGVGAFGACMTALRDAELVRPVLEAARTDRPFLGICVGMQMMCRSSDESPDVDGLGIFDVKVIRMRGEVKLPQMQWNKVRVHFDGHPLFRGLDEPWMYFVHSYAVEENDDTIAVCDYGGQITAAMARGPVAAVQFHPEKSAADGLALLSNFVDWVKAER
jgi:glutamine amidotransferase